MSSTAPRGAGKVEELGNWTDTGHVRGREGAHDRLRRGDQRRQPAPHLRRTGAARIRDRRAVHAADGADRERSSRRTSSCGSSTASRTCSSTSRSCPAWSSHPRLPDGVHKAGSGITLHTKVETKTADGEPVNDQWMIAFFRGADDDLHEGEKAPAHKRRAGAALGRARRRRRPALRQRSDLPLRAASGDPMPIHTRRGVREVGRPARDHHPRALHDGDELRCGRAGVLRRRSRAAEAPRGPLLEAGPAG